MPKARNPEAEKAEALYRKGERLIDIAKEIKLPEVKLGKDGASIKLADQHKAMDWLANYFMLNPNDKHKHEFDQQWLEIEKEKLDLERAKANLPDPDDDSTGVVVLPGRLPSEDHDPYQEGQNNSNEEGES